MRSVRTVATGLALCLLATGCSNLTTKECSANLCVSHVKVQCDQATGLAATDIKIELPEGVTGRQMFSLKITRHTPEGDKAFVDLQTTITDKTPFTKQLTFRIPITTEVRTIEGDGKVFKTRFEAPCS